MFWTMKENMHLLFSAVLGLGLKKLRLKELVLSADLWPLPWSEQGSLQWEKRAEKCESMEEEEVSLVFKPKVGGWMDSFG